MGIREIFGRLRRPAKPEHVLEDEVLGRLVWSEKYGGWGGVLSLAMGGTARFTIEGVEVEETITEASRHALQFLTANEPRIRNKIAASMSELYNGTWGGGDDTLTPEEMARRIALASAHFYEDGGGVLYYEAADNLFTDHTICVHINADGEIEEPELEG
jgi:hypothetical protein